MNRAHCPKCQTAFQPQRTNQTYCSRQCQQNASRGSRAANVSRSQQADNARDWHLLGYLNERYYGTKPAERLGLLKDWLDAARAGDARLARVLSKPAFRVSFKDDRRIYHRWCWACPPVPLLADQFCRHLRDCRVWEWVNGSAPEPETGEILIADIPPPAYGVAAQPQPGVAPLFRASYSWLSAEGDVVHDRVGVQAQPLRTRVVPEAVLGAGPT